MPTWLTTLAVAAAGGGVALGGAALTVGLGGGSTTVVRDGTPLPAPQRSAAAAAVDARGDAPAAGVPAVVAASTPAVVTVTTGGDGQGRLGTGFLVDDRGRILTNAHVVGDDRDVSVAFEDGSERDAEVLGDDESTDLAVLQVEDVPRGLRPLPLGASDALVVGDPVIAIGNPFGLDGSATTGIVSAVKRVIEAPDGFAIQNVIQTDAAINQGNSGGPLLDSRGRVVGINTQIASQAGGNDGVGFAVPIDTIRPVADSIIATGRARHAWLGVTGRPVTPDVARELGRPELRGVAVVEVDDRGPAKRAGIAPATSGRTADVPRGGDVIVAVDGEQTRDMADVSSAVSSRSVGDRIALTVLRADGSRETLRMTLADRPADVGVATAP